MILNHRLWLRNIAPTHLSEYSTTFFFVEIVVCDYAFSEHHQSILHTLPPIVVEMTCALQVFHLFLELIYPTSDFDMGFL
jgi:uncharacterized PurR-regulated membrane protein YhhQ (DUF165 family)